VVEAMLLQPALTTFEIAFAASAILIPLNPVPPPLIRGSLDNARQPAVPSFPTTQAFLRGLTLL